MSAVHPLASSEALDWSAANQRDVARRLNELLAMLAQASGWTGTDEPLPAAAPTPEEAALGPFALDRLTRLFDLSSFERDVLLLSAAVELDARFGPLVAFANGDPARRRPTFGLALALLPDAHWSALAPDAALRGWRLVEVVGGGLTNAELRIDERILHYLAGVETRDERLSGLVEDVPVPPGQEDDFAPESGVPAVALAAHLRPLDDRPLLPSASPVAAQLVGGSRARREGIAAQAAAAMAARLIRAAAADIPENAAERHALARLLSREALLDQALVLIDADDGRADAHRGETGVGTFLSRILVPAIVATREPMAGLSASAPVFEIGEPSGRDRARAWHLALGSRAASLNGTVGALAAQFRLDDAAIRSIATRVSGADAEGGASARGGTEVGRDLGGALWDAARAATRPRMDGLAQRIEPIARWDDLVLPEAQRRALRQIVGQVRQRHRVYEEWGFAGRSHRGLGVTALFSGPSGTGKTMAAEVLARELQLDLYRIDLATVVSKYIGETEKNLRRVFDAAEGSGAILLFDEADALFGKRSEVRDSHDRYANVEIGYLLQRMETFDGLAILTTNMKDALDAAFQRRLRFIVTFPFPDPALRAEIWRRVFPPETPTDRLDVERLAQLSIAGGSIRNVALGAAFLAADRGESVEMRHVAEAARTEYDKLERTLGDSETRGWA